MSDEKAPSSIVVPDRDVESQDPLIGQVLGERYCVEKRLNQGAMGVVYRARHVLLDSQLAVKVLRKTQKQDDQQRFLQEAQLASTVSHPNTVQIVDFGVLPGGLSYLVMELMRGRTLASEVEKGAMEVLRVCHIGTQIARGLQAVHDQGIIHRDMKPENVFLLERDGNADFIKIVDFGIAKSVNAAESSLVQAEKSSDAISVVSRREFVKTKAGNILGTPPYMAPEQCIGKQIDWRCDQYALGCMLYEMLTGELMFEEKTVVRYMEAHLRNAPVPPRKRTPERNIPEVVEAVVMRMLEKKPQARFGSMKEVAEALTQAADFVLIERGEKTVLPPGLSVLFGSWLKGSHLVVHGRKMLGRATLAALAGLLVLALGSAAYLDYRHKKADQSPEKPTIELWQLQAAQTSAFVALWQATQPGESTGSDRAIRLDAIGALAETRYAGLRTTFEPQLGDLDETVQVAAAAALGRLGDRAALPALQAARERSKSGLVRLTVARSMLDLGGSGEEVLLAALGSRSPAERLQAASLLCDRRNPTADMLLLQSVDEGRLDSNAMLTALGCVLKSENAEGARARLRIMLKDAPSAERRTEIARVLSQAGDAAGRRALREIASKPGPLQLTAARAMASPDEPEAAALFRHVLRDLQAQHMARLLASEGLGHSGQLLDVLLVGKLLGSPEPDLRAAGAAAVLRLVAADSTALGRESLSWARENLDVTDWKRRESAALVIGDSASPEAAGLLAPMLRDEDARVRRGVARALGRQTDEPALLALKDGLRDPDAEVRIETLRSLGRVSQSLRKTGARDVLQRVSGWFGELLASSPPREQILARTVLWELGDTRQAVALAVWKSDKDPAVRRFLIEQSPAAATIALSLLKDPDSGVRFAAAQKLAEGGDASGLDALKAALAQGGPDGVAAYGLLIRIGQPVAEQTVVQAALATTRPVPERMAAVAAMSRLPAALAVPLLAKAARDPEPLVRRLSAEVVADLPKPQGHRAPGFLVLRMILSDSDPAVKNRVAALIGRIGTKDAPQPPAEKGVAEKAPPRYVAR